MAEKPSFNLVFPDNIKMVGMHPPPQKKKTKLRRKGFLLVVHNSSNM
jgi:hypothetical protein